MAKDTKALAEKVDALERVVHHLTEALGELQEAMEKIAERAGMPREVEIP